MKNVSEITVCVFDHGLFVPLAQRLARDCKRVLYFCHWADAFPSINRGMVGDGFEGVERIESIWPHLDDIDLFVFPDIFDAGLQQHLWDLGKIVWGSRTGDQLEINRRKFMHTVSELGLQVPRYEVITGLAALRSHLMDKEDKYIKVSKWRGSFETMHWRDWEHDEGVLDILAVRFGPVKELIPFLVFDAIDTDLEIGGDTYCVDGQFPNKILHGLELKDKGFIGSVMDYQDVPEQIRKVNDAFSPIMKEKMYRNFWSAEIRVKGEDFYFLDATCRGGVPSLSSQMELWSNFSDILWHGAHGACLDPEPTANFSIECVIKNHIETDEWGVLDIPDDIRQWVKCGNCCEIDGKICFPPWDFRTDDRGWLVAIGNTIGEALASLKQYAEQLPDGYACDILKLAEIIQEIHSAEEQGVDFSDRPVPKPEIVLTENG